MKWSNVNAVSKSSATNGALTWASPVHCKIISLYPFAAAIIKQSDKQQIRSRAACDSCPWWSGRCCCQARNSWVLIFPGHTWRPPGRQVPISYRGQHKPMPSLVGLGVRQTQRPPGRQVPISYRGQHKPMPSLVRLGVRWLPNAPMHLWERRLPNAEWERGLPIQRWFEKLYLPPPDKWLTKILIIKEEIKVPRKKQCLTWSHSLATFSTDLNPRPLALNRDNQQSVT